MVLSVDATFAKYMLSEYTKPFLKFAGPAAFVNNGDIIKPFIEYKEDTSNPEYILKQAFSAEVVSVLSLISSHIVTINICFS